MVRFDSRDFGILLLRITCGGLLLFHGSHKVFREIQHVKDIVKAAGLPEFFAYGNILGEFIAPLFIIIGYKSKIAAFIVAVNMLLSILLAHRDIMFMRNDFGGWMIELNVFYMMAALAICFTGSGRYSVSKGLGKWD